MYCISSDLWNDCDKIGNSNFGRAIYHFSIAFTCVIAYGGQGLS